MKADLNRRRSESHSQDQLVFHMPVTHLASSTKYKVDLSDQISSFQLDGHKNAHSSAMTSCRLHQGTTVWLILVAPRGGIQVKVTVLSPLQDSRLKKHRNDTK